MEVRRKRINETVLCSRTRPSQIGEEIYDGGFGYTLDFSWAKWPKDLEGVHTLNGCFDPEGNLYVATENPENPVSDLLPGRGDISVV